MRDHPVKLTQTDRSKSRGSYIQAPAIKHNQPISGTIRDRAGTRTAPYQGVCERPDTGNMGTQFGSKSVGMQLGAGLISSAELGGEAQEWGNATGQRCVPSI